MVKEREILKHVLSTCNFVSLCLQCCLIRPVSLKENFSAFCFTLDWTFSDWTLSASELISSEMVTTCYHLKARDAYARDKPIEFKGPSTDTKLIHSMFSCLRPNFHNKLKACSSQKKMTSAAIGFGCHNNQETSEKQRGNLHYFFVCAIIKRKRNGYSMYDLYIKSYSAKRWIRRFCPAHASVSLCSW